MFQGINVRFKTATFGAELLDSCNYGGLDCSPKQINGHTAEGMPKPGVGHARLRASIKVSDSRRNANVAGKADVFGQSRIGIVLWRQWLNAYGSCLYKFSTRQLRFNIVQNGRIPQIGIFITM
ncbi:hypothetical protein Dxin01_02785 [Deinococcus xinjiangensis]|uniref:Uncharacterized protein n=1 Tax=Deinococcus xinjiangensis TaxID=457454 RepID=A0ABP9VE90_9DEIO